MKIVFLVENATGKSSSMIIHLNIMHRLRKSKYVQNYNGSYMYMSIGICIYNILCDKDNLKII